MRILTLMNVVDKFTHLSSSVSSTESDVHIRLAKAWTAIDMLSIIRKSDLSDKIKRDFFQTMAVSILLYGWTTWTLTKRIDGNYTRILRAILNKSWKQYPHETTVVQPLTSHLKNIEVRRTRREGHWWRSQDKLISDVLLWTPTNGHDSKNLFTYADTECSWEDLPGAMDDRERESGKSALSAWLDDDDDEDFLNFNPKWVDMSLKLGIWSKQQI